MAKILPLNSLGNEKIFIQIATYRDPLLKSTIVDCIKRASYPDNLVFGICNQFHPDDEDQLEEYRSNPQFKIVDHDISKAPSPGVCWARNAIQQLYEGEEYTLQIDSHMRFVDNWDTILIQMLKELQIDGYKKPLITTYAPSFEPNNDPNGRTMVPWQMNFDRFIPEGAIFFLPATIPNWQTRTKPVRGRFYSAHFAFTIGKFCEEVQHNPEYYFHGEEISIAVRAYTWGYDIFHPHKCIIWHEYTRKGRIKHWDDDSQWTTRNSKSHLTNRKLFGMDGLEQEGHTGKYGFGPVRSLRDYERYAGIHFGKRSIQKYTLDHKEPPNPVIEDDEAWLNSFTREFKHCINVHSSSVPENDYTFWVVAFKDKNEIEIFRKDASLQEIKSSVSGDWYNIWRNFPVEEQPKSWLVWPYSQSKGWCNQITGQI